MSIFLTEQEKRSVHAARGSEPFNDLYWQFLNRAQATAAEPGLRGAGITQEYWHMAFDVLSVVAMIHALKPDDLLAGWLRGATLELVRRPEEEWVGPWYRDHASEPRKGHLETAHLSWACAVALDLAPEAFREDEREEIRSKLRNVAIPLCLEHNRRAWQHVNNWYCILTAGLAVSAAVVDDRAAMDQAAETFNLLVELFQPDGSYGESLQYSYYAQIGLYLTYEALVRRDPSYAKRLNPERYARSVRWAAASYFYHKPLDGWGSTPRPRSANFNDSAALFQPPADILLHVSARCRETLPAEAGLARWMFDTCYLGDRAREPIDLASFGFYNTVGFLTLPLLTQAAEPKTPQEAGLSELEAFSNGDAVLRDSHSSRTIVAVYGGCDDLHVKSHRHAALNSGIVVHNRERLLVDPGHSCYRGLIHGLEMQTQSHNAVTFSVGSQAEGGSQEDKARFVPLQQSADAGRRTRSEHAAGPLLAREATRLISASNGPLRVVGHDAAAAYGEPIRSAERYWILCGANVLFVVDRFAADRPVRATYNWLINNRDRAAEFKPVPPDRIVVRRGTSGMKLFHLGGGSFQGPVYGFVHDCYHPLPDQRGEGASGSGLIVRWTDPSPAVARSTVHAIALDSYGSVAGWHLKDATAAGARLEYGNQNWTCSVATDEITVTDHASGTAYRIVNGSSGCLLTTE